MKNNQNVQDSEQEFDDDGSELPLGRLFRNPTAKVLDFLLLNRDFDYSESDISKLAEVSPRTVQRVLPILIDEKIVKRTRKSGKAFMYEASLDSKRTTALLAYVKATIEENLENPKLLEEDPIQ